MIKHFLNLRAKMCGRFDANLAGFMFVTLLTNKPFWVLSPLLEEHTIHLIAITKTYHSYIPVFIAAARARDRVTMENGATVLCIDLFCLGEGVEPPSVGKQIVFSCWSFST